MKLNPDSFEALTFDCYGTLIDWDGGILAALGSIPALADTDLERLVADREREEQALLAGPFRRYGEILAQSMLQAAALQNAHPSPEDAAEFATSMGAWPAFDDSSGALNRLARRLKLVILSNVEEPVIADSAELLDAPFDLRITAEAIGSYKPATVHFEEALRQLDLPASKILHVAGSLYHDIQPARALGWSTAWINRRGEAVPDELDSDHVFPDVAALADSFGL